MKHYRILLELLSLLPAFYYVPAAAEADCRLQRAAELNLETTPHGDVYVKAAIGGQPVNLLIDTAAPFGLLMSRTVSDLHLESRLIDVERLRISMYGGQIFDHYTVTHSFQLGRLKSDNISFVILPGEHLRSTLDGTLAVDVLSAYDVELDFFNGKLNLFLQDHCPGQVVYWTQQPYASVLMRIDRNGHMSFPVTLDGKPEGVIIDTGSTTSVMSLDAARDLFGWNTDTEQLKAVNDDDSPEKRVYRYPFKTLTFDGITINNPDITLVPDTLSKWHGHGSDIIIGVNTLRQLHVYIAYSEKRLYLTAADAR